MKTIIRVEHVGDDFYWQKRDGIESWKFELYQLRKYSGYVCAPTVERLIKTENGFVKKTINKMTDYSKSNRDGSRGIYSYYIVEDGIYEINDMTDYKKRRKYFLLVAGGKKRIISESEAMECLKKDI